MISCSPAPAQQTQGRYRERLAEQRRQLEQLAGAAGESRSSFGDGGLQGERHVGTQLATADHVEQQPEEQRVAAGLMEKALAQLVVRAKRQRLAQELVDFACVERRQLEHGDAGGVHDRRMRGRPRGEHQMNAVAIEQ